MYSSAFLYITSWVLVSFVSKGDVDVASGRFFVRFGSDDSVTFQLNFLFFYAIDFICFLRCC
jgi:hypothetical protein